MDIPLGSAVGNAVEVLEAVDILKGNDTESDLYTVCLALAANMLVLCHGISLDDANKAAKESVKSGKALEKFREWIKAQGGSDGFIESESEIFSPKFEADFVADNDGYVSSIDTEKVGKAACTLGAGRETSADVIDMHACIRLYIKTGERVRRGEKIATLYANDEEKLKKGAALLREAYTFTDSQAKAGALIYAISE
jgi:thymidine phosphorylase